jgi:hypothetical protein
MDKDVPWPSYEKRYLQDRPHRFLVRISFLISTPLLSTTRTASILTMSFPLFCMGNPLLDIQVKANEELLARYILSFHFVSFNSNAWSQEQALKFNLGRCLSLSFSPTLSFLS